MAADGYSLRLLSHDPLAAEAVFPRNHPGFDGHFPDGAILPGFLHVQLALDVLHTAGLACELRELSDAKFTAPIVPDLMVQMTLRPLGGTGNYAVAITAADGRNCSAFRLLAG